MGAKLVFGNMHSLCVTAVRPTRRDTVCPRVHTQPEPGPEDKEAPAGDTDQGRRHGGQHTAGLALPPAPK